MELPSKSANYLSLFSYSSPIAVPASVRPAAQKCWRSIVRSCFIQPQWRASYGPRLSFITVSKLLWHPPKWCKKTFYNVCSQDLAYLLDLNILKLLIKLHAVLNLKINNAGSKTAIKALW